jgi:WhiB family redox-sensing transcriptional regulator
VDVPPWIRHPEPLACTECPEAFFPYGYGREYRGEIEEARALCAACPVREMCLAWAVARPELDGIWAATTPPERRRLRTRRAALAR